MRRITSLVLVALLLVISIPFSAAADTALSHSYDAKNSTRYENEMIIYTYTNGYTGTNTYGYEVTVTNGVVTSVGGNNSYIPNNGFVVSGHGTAAEWLSANIIVGMKATYSDYPRTITFTVDADVYKNVIDNARKSAISAKEYAVNACLIYDENADARLSAAEIRYNKLSGSVSEAVSKELSAEYNAIAALYRERSATEYRGIWLRPTQTSVSAVESFVRKAYQSGINMISIETLYDCTMIYPVPSGSYFEQNPLFNGFDVLGAFADACHRYGIELHCWMPVFYSGDTASKNWSRSVAAKKPEWALTTNNGSMLYSDESTGMVFLNPGIPAVQDFLADTYTYILNKYDIDGFQLDYIRYRDRTGNDDYGYDATTIARFKEAYPQYRNYSITYNSNSMYWNSWVNFRASLVGDFVQRMRGLIDSVSPNVILSADVGPDPNSSYSAYYQNSTYWLTQGWLDMIHPMAYGEGYESYMQKFFNCIESGCIVVPGLGIFMDEFDAQDMVDQTKKMIDIGCAGVVYFEAETFNSKGCGKLLSETLFTEWALPPALNNANTIVAEAERYKERLDKAYDSGKIDWQTQNDLTWIANQAISAAKNENAAAAAEWTADLKATTISRLADSDLRANLVKNANNANEAALRDNGIDVYTEKEEIDDSIPSDAVGVAQLIIDKVNGEITGEDSSLITDPSKMANYNVKYAYVMLLKPVGYLQNVYEIVEAKQNIGAATSFKTAITPGMLVAAFHTDNVGSGLARRDLAKSLKVGTHLVLYGVDVSTGGFTSLNPMLYVYSGDVTPPVVDPDMDCDVNADGVVDMFDYLIVKSVYFEVPGVNSADAARSDVNKDGVVDMFDYLLVRTAYFQS